MPPLLGFSGRFSRKQWRPALSEISFAQAGGWGALQFSAPEGGLTHRHVGAELAEVGQALKEAGVTAVVELPITLTNNALTLGERPPLDVLHANLPAIRALRAPFVYMKFLPNWPLSEAKCRALEQILLPQLSEASRLGDEYGFQFGITHNESRVRLFAGAEVMRQTLQATHGLGFVWQTCHTPHEELPAYLPLLSRLMVLIMTDRPAYLPLGRGAVNFLPFLQTVADRNFTKPLLVHIASAPTSVVSGEEEPEHGRDPDTLLQEAHQYLNTLWKQINP
jgi:sugar phosphate isomerase/epimerase